MHDGEPILKRITRTAADALKEHIREAGGREVFFAAVVNEQTRVEQVRVLARGNAEAVPALFAQLNLREVVLHNHPEGNLEPSDADLELAAIYSAHGHGVYIIDNEATRVYVVVEPFIPQKKILLNAREMDGAFASGGTLSRGIAAFELRPQQIQMADAIVDAFNADGITIIEAPTGVGKTMAYLLPAIQWSLRNKERIVISTRTINLQEQIIHHDIPLLKRCLNESFHFCLVKGRSNYLCRRKLDSAFAELTLFEDDVLAGQLRLINEWTEHTIDGTLSDLHFVPDRRVWDRVCCEADMCGGGNCRHARECFLGRARKEMARADLIVANHHMVFADVSVKRELGDFTSAAVLPKYARVIFDEAHNMEDAATEYFGLSATRSQLHKTMGRLLRIEMQTERGLLPFLKLKLMRNCPQVSSHAYEEFTRFLDDQLQPALYLTREAMDDAFTALREYAATHSGQLGRDIKWRITEDILAHPELRALHQEYIVPAVNNARVFIQMMEKLFEKLGAVKPLEPGDEPPLQMECLELTACIRRMEAMANALIEFTEDVLEDNTVRWIEVDGQNENFVRIARCPLSVGKSLAEWVYGNVDTAIMTSATLAVRKQFNYFMERVGLNLISENRVNAVLLDSPFNYAQQALFCLPTDGPDPKASNYLEELVIRIRRILQITRGHAFVLFTSFYALDFVYRHLEEELEAQCITPLCQGKETRSRLIEKFRSDAASVLFATDSFWEGVDVAGDALQCVIVARLPFRVPSEPVMEARAQAIEQAGGNAFMQYSLPQAVIKMRQGFGRLIRRRTDWGAVVVLDNRIATKYYGRFFLSSLPPMTIARGEAEKVWIELEHFFEKKRNNPAIVSSV